MSADLESDKPQIAYFYNTLTEEVVMDFLGTIRASDTLLPITPEKAVDLEREFLWGELDIDLYDGDDTHEELERRRAIKKISDNN